MRLAEHLRMPRGAMLAAMDSRELSDWQAWEQIHGPLGAERADYLAAGISLLIAEIHRDQKKGRRFKIWDFLTFRLPGAEPAGSGNKISDAASLFAWVQAMKARTAALGKGHSGEAGHR